MRSLSFCISMPAAWPYRTPGIPDREFNRIPGIPLSSREVRVLLLSQLRLPERGCLWDIGAGTGNDCGGGWFAKS